MTDIVMPVILIVGVYELFKWLTKRVFKRFRKKKGIAYLDDFVSRR